MKILKDKYKYLLILTSMLLYFNIVQSQYNLLIQANDPHPYIEIQNWETYKADIPFENITAIPSKDWKNETLNKIWRDTNIVKWFKSEVTIPKNFEGMDCILEIRVDGWADVYIIDQKSFVAEHKFGRGVLAVSAIAGKKYDIALKIRNGKWGGRLYMANLTAFPNGYNQVVESLEKIYVLNGKTERNTKNAELFSKTKSVDYFFQRHPLPKKVWFSEISNSINSILKKNDSEIINELITYLDTLSVYIN